jgi:hypothetical protein
MSNFSSFTGILYPIIILLMTFKLKILCGHLLTFYDAREITCIANSLLKGSVFRYPKCYTVMVNIFYLFHLQAFVTCVWYVTLAYVAVDQDSLFYSRLYSNYRNTVIMLFEIQVKILYFSVFPKVHFLCVCNQINITNISLLQQQNTLHVE